MKNEVQGFVYQKLTVRTFIDEKEETWFVAKDVCDALELVDVSMSLKKLDDDEKLIQKVFVSGQQRETWTVNESGLYHIVLTSTKPEAKAFRMWVTNEVLPDIRKAGKYTTDQAQTKELVIQRLMTEIEDVEKSITACKAELKTWNEAREVKLSDLRRAIRSNPNQLELFPIAEIS